MSAGIPGALGYLSVFAAALVVVLDVGRRGKSVAASLLAGLLVAYGVSNLFLFDTVTSYMVVTLLLGCLHAHWIGARPVPVGARRVGVAVALAAPLAVSTALVVASVNLPAYRALRLWRDAAPMTDLGWDDKVAALEAALALDSFIDEELRRAYLELASVVQRRYLPAEVHRRYVEAAVAHMQELAGRAPERARHVEDLGRFLVASGRPEQGLGYLLAAMDRMPARPALRLEVAGALERVGRAEEALEMARTAHELEPRHDWPLLYYSGMAHSHGQTDLAVALLAPAPTDPVPEAMVSSLLPAQLGGETTPEDRRWLEALLDFDARRDWQGTTSWTLVELGQALPRLRNTGDLSRAAVRVESQFSSLMRPRTIGGGL